MLVVGMAAMIPAVGNRRTGPEPATTLETVIPAKAGTHAERNK
jgi:hypothetical protein